MRKLYQWQETPNHQIYLNVLPKYLSRENKSLIDKFIGKQIRRDIMAGDFISAFFFLKNWIGTTEQGARDIYQNILMDTFDAKGEDVSKGYMVKKNLIDPYFNRLENSMFGRELNQATLHALSMQGFRNEKASEKMMEVFRLIDMRKIKPTSPQILSYINRNRISYQEAVVIEQEARPKYDRKAARNVIPQNTQSKLDKASGIAKKLRNI